VRRRSKTTSSKTEAVRNYTQPFNRSFRPPQAERRIGVAVAIRARVEDVERLIVRGDAVAEVIPGDVQCADGNLDRRPDLVAVAGVVLHLNPASHVPPPSVDRWT
jgi:hypothetical protein